MRSFAATSVPARLRLVVGIEGTAWENDWDLWLYPAAIASTVPADIHVTGRLDEQAQAHLTAGGKVLLLVPPRAVKGDVAIGFSSIFWNTAWTRNQPPHTLGILCDPKHVALAQFPTEYHSNWQWWELISRSGAMVLDELPPRLRPLVQVIDTWFTARRLGLVFEAQVAGGKLLVCSIDLDSDLGRRPVARQLRRCLLEYMNSEKFQPAVKVGVAAIRGLVRPLSPIEQMGATVSADSEMDGYPATHVLDGDPATIWHTPWGSRQRPFPHHLVIDLKQRTTVSGLKYLPRQDMPNGRIARYCIYASVDGSDWGQPLAQGNWPNDGQRKSVTFRPCQARFLKLVAEAEVNGHVWAAAAEIEPIFE